MQAWSCGALHAGGVPNHSQHNGGPATLWHDDDNASDWQPHRATDHEGAGEFAVISDVRDARQMRHTNKYRRRDIHSQILQLQEFSEFAVSCIQSLHVHADQAVLPLPSFCPQSETVLKLLPPQPLQSMLPLKKLLVICHLFPPTHLTSTSLAKVPRDLVSLLHFSIGQHRRLVH